MKSKINSIPIWIMHIHLVGTMDVINASESLFSSSQSKSMVDVDCIAHRTKYTCILLMETFQTNETDSVLHIVSFFSLQTNAIIKTINSNGLELFEIWFSDKKLDIHTPDESSQNGNIQGSHK